MHSTSCEVSLEITQSCISAGYVGGHWHDLQFYLCVGYIDHGAGAVESRGAQQHHAAAGGYGQQVVLRPGDGVGAGGQASQIGRYRWARWRRRKWRDRHAVVLLLQG